MFLGFFYALRQDGINVSPDEWLTLMEALNSGMCSDLMGFYELCRMITVKKESDFDKFDTAFGRYFKGLRTAPDPREELMRWVNEDAERGEGKWRDVDYDDVLKNYRRLLDEQKEQHNEGRKWIGQRGYTAYGNAGQYRGGVRVGGESYYRSAFAVVDSHAYADFREDQTLGIRQYQVALRKLRQLSNQLPLPKTELDLDATIDDTCKNGGFLKVHMKKPRKNTLRLLLLMDSGGSMTMFSSLCSSLFHAVEKANFFRDVRVYYFHNCVYSHLYTDPSCSWRSAVDTERVMRLYDGNYRLIVVGDAQMDPGELYYPRTAANGVRMGLSGIQWLDKLRSRYKRSVWLNPDKHTFYNDAFWLITEQRIAALFPMYKLSVRGLNDAVRALVTAKG